MFNPGQNLRFYCKMYILAHLTMLEHAITANSHLCIHMSIPLMIPTSMTLISVLALILCFSPNSIDLLANYITVVEDRHIMFVNIVSQFQSSTVGHN